MDGATVFISDGNGEVLIKGLPAGKYYLVETKAPEGYKKNKEDHEFSVSEAISKCATEDYIQNFKGVDADEASNVCTIDPDAKGKIIVNTFDTNQNKIKFKSSEGPTYVLYNYNNRIIRTQSANQDGTVIFNNLSKGTYKVFMKTVPKSYARSSDFKEVEITPSTNEFVLNFTAYPVAIPNSGALDPNPFPGDNFDGDVMVNGEKTYKVNFIKVNSDGERLEGAEFIINNLSKGYLVYKSTGYHNWTGHRSEATVFKSDKNGLISIDKLLPGEYVLEEIKAPKSYFDNHVLLNFTVSEENEICQTEIYVENTKDTNYIPNESGVCTFDPDNKGEVNIEVFSVNTDEKITLDEEQKETFVLLNFSGKIIRTGDLDKNGNVVFKNLPLGKYTLKKIKAIRGYATPEINEVFELTPCNSSKKLKLYAKLMMVGETGTFPIYTGGWLYGPSTYYFDDEAASQITKQSKIYNNKSKSDYLIQISIPQRETVNKGFKVINSPGAGVNIDISSIKIQNKDNMDMNTSWYNIVPTVDGGFYIDFLTDKFQWDNWYLFNIRYTADLSTRKPENSVKIEIVKDSGVIATSESRNIEPEYKDEIFDYKFIKIDADDCTKLEGAEFKIKNSSGEWMIETPIGEYADWTSDESEASVLKSNAEGETWIYDLSPGTYYIVETKAPEGYKRNKEEFEFRVSKEDEICQTETYIKNEKGSDVEDIQIYKHKFIKKDADTGEGIPGAVFNVQNSEGKWLCYVDGKTTWVDSGKRTDFVSGENGEFTVDKIGVGAYTLHEITPPDGYEIINESTPFIVIASGEDVDNTLVTVVNNKNKQIKKISVLPHTGKYDALIIAMVISSLISAAVIVSYRRRKYI